jgi:hemolysin activation/secretion protein
MRRLMLVLSVGVIMAMVVVAGAAPTLAQTSEDKAAKKAARQEQKAAKQQQKAAKQQAPKQQPAPKQQLPASGGPPVGNVALFTLGASALVVGGVFLVGRTVAPRR